MNIYENIKNVIRKWGYTYKINNISAATDHRLPKLVSNYGSDTCLFPMVYFTNYLISIICVFMNINKIVEKLRKIIKNKKAGFIPIFSLVHVIYHQ